MDDDEKNLFTVLAMACCMLCSHVAYADPVFDDDNWNKIFDGKDAKLPTKAPTGKGIVSNMNAAKRQQIVNPYDMKENQNIDISEFAIETKRYFASQSQKDFIEATAKEFKIITGDPNIKLPIAELGFESFDYPHTQAKNSSITVDFGWFGSENGKVISIPKGYYKQNTNDISANSNISKMDASIDRYIELCKEQMTSLKKLEGRRLETKLREIQENARNELMPRRNKEKENQDLLEEKWARVQAREQAGKAGWDTDFNGGDALADDREKKRKNSKRRKKIKKYQVDLAKTWDMIEAIVTQNEVRITKLTIPLAIEEVLLLHAKTNKRPENIIKRVMELNIDTKKIGGNISVTLACSIRDRFMGCSQSSKYQIDSEENKIKNISTNLEKAAKNANQKQKDIVNELISNTTR